VRLRSLGQSVSLLFRIRFVAPTLHAGPHSFELLPTGEDAPHLFAKGVISTPSDEGAASSARTVAKFYFRADESDHHVSEDRTSCVSHWNGKSWSRPEALPFSGKYLDFRRASPDGKTMYFASSRLPVDSKAHVLRIWRVHRTGDNWGEPVPVPAPINSDDRWNWGASVTTDGTMYFARSRRTGHPQIYRSRFVNGATSPRKNWGPRLIPTSMTPIRTSALMSSLLFFVSAGEGGPPFRHRPDTLTGADFPTPAATFT
jgi:hypothetical protein